MEIFYPLGIGARIKGKIHLSQYEITGLLRHKIIQDIFLQLAQQLSGTNKQADRNLKESKEKQKEESSLSIFG